MNRHTTHPLRRPYCGLPSRKVTRVWGNVLGITDLQALPRQHGAYNKGVYIGCCLNRQISWGGSLASLSRRAPAEAARLLLDHGLRGAELSVQLLVRGCRSSKAVHIWPGREREGLPVPDVDGVREHSSHRSHRGGH